MFDIDKLWEYADTVNTIYLDIDGVVINSVQANLDILNKMYDKYVTQEELINWNFNDHFPLTDNIVEDLFSSNQFFNIVEFYDGVEDFLHEFRDKIIFITKGGMENIYKKNKFMRDNGFGDIPLIGIPIGVSKGVVNMNGGLFIDDCVCNLNESNASIKVMYYDYEDREWNKGWNGLKFNSWE